MAAARGTVPFLADSISVVRTSAAVSSATPEHWPPTILEIDAMPCATPSESSDMSEVEDATRFIRLVRASACARVSASAAACACTASSVLFTASSLA